MKSKTVWNDEYRGIGFEVQNFKLSDRDAWTFYLYIPLDAIPENIRERFWLDPKKNDFSFRIHYDYSDEPLINSIEWHSGCTWYEKLGMDGAPRAIRIGCDYQHYWDEGHFQNVELVAMDAKRAIDSFLKLVPNIMNCCGWDGRFVPESEGEYHGDVFYSHKGWTLSEKSRAEWNAKYPSPKK